MLVREILDASFGFDEAHGETCFTDLWPIVLAGHQPGGLDMTTAASVLAFTVKEMSLLMNCSRNVNKTNNQNIIYGKHISLFVFLTL